MRFQQLLLTPELATGGLALVTICGPVLESSPAFRNKPVHSLHWILANGLL